MLIDFVDNITIDPNSYKTTLAIRYCAMYNGSGSGLFKEMDDTTITSNYGLVNPESFDDNVFGVLPTYERIALIHKSSLSPSSLVPTYYKYSLYNSRLNHVNSTKLIAWELSLVSTLDGTPETRTTPIFNELARIRWRVEVKMFGMESFGFKVLLPDYGLIESIHDM